MRGLLVALCVFYTVSAYVDYSGDQVLRVQIRSQEQYGLLETLREELQLDVWHEARFVGDHSDVHVSKLRVPVIKTWLQNHGFDFSVMVADVGELIGLERAQRSVQKTSKKLDYYRTLAEVNEWIDDIAAEFPELVTVVEVATSYEGRTIRLLKISTGASRPAFWMDSGIHSREWVAPATNIYYADTLLRSYGEDAEITELMDEMDFYILPVFNVDGYEYTWTDDRLWRKTRSPNQGSACVGTDPNRNYDYRWGEVSAGGPCTQTFPGDSPFSEREVREVAEYMETIPDLRAIFGIHSYGQMYMAPYGFTTENNPDYDEQMVVCNEAITALEAVHGMVYRCDSLINLVGPNSGSVADWGYEVLGVKFSFGVELRDRGEFGFVLPANQIIPTAEENFEAMKVFFRAVLDDAKQ